VVTRWYRAPELILLANDYSAAIDMWSCGCIFAELLSMLPSPTKPRNPNERVALFPGRTCFPLSADDNPLAYADQRDQLNVIFDVIGTPKEDDIAQLASEKARNYVRSVRKRGPTDFAKKYPEAGSEALDLLRKLLEFDPHKRYTADQALGHAYLAEVRNPDNEDESKFKLTSEMSAKYFAFEDEPCTNEHLKELLAEQIAHDTPELQLILGRPQGSVPTDRAKFIKEASQLAKEFATTAAVTKQQEQQQQQQQLLQQQPQQGQGQGIGQQFFQGQPFNPSSLTSSSQTSSSMLPAVGSSLFSFSSETESKQDGVPISKMGPPPGFPPRPKQ